MGHGGAVIFWMVFVFALMAAVGVVGAWFLSKHFNRELSERRRRNRPAEDPPRLINPPGNLDDLTRQTFAKHLAAEISPGKGVGPFRLGMNEASVVAKLAVPYTRSRSDDTVLIEAPPFRFWFTDEFDQLQQVCLYKGFTGTLANGVRLGSRVEDLAGFVNLNSARWRGDALLFSSTKGILFIPECDKGTIRVYPGSGELVTNDIKTLTIVGFCIRNTYDC